MSKRIVFLSLLIFLASAVCFPSETASESTATNTMPTVGAKSLIVWMSIYAIPILIILGVALRKLLEIEKEVFKIKFYMSSFKNQTITVNHRTPGVFGNGTAEPAK